MCDIIYKENIPQAQSKNKKKKKQLLNFVNVQKLEIPCFVLLRSIYKSVEVIQPNISVAIMDIANQATEPSTAPAESMSLKEYYENFKYELTEADFADEEVSFPLVKEEEVSSPLVKIESMPAFEFINLAPDRIIRPIKEEPQSSEVDSKRVKIEKLENAMQEKTLKPAKTSKISKIKKVFTKLANRQPVYLFTCQRCKKGFAKEAHFKNHCPVGCDREITFTQRRRSNKKIFA